MAIKEIQIRSRFTFTLFLSLFYYLIFLISTKKKMKNNENFMLCIIRFRSIRSCFSLSKFHMLIKTKKMKIKKKIYTK